MSRFPPATRKDHERFCQIEGWTLRRTDHDRYFFDLPDGDTLYTWISRPPNRTEYGTSMWAGILRDQLRVSDQEFWDCTKHRRLPDRGGPPEPTREALPAGLVAQLIAHGVTESEIRTMTKAEAIKRLTDLYSESND